MLVSGEKLNDTDLLDKDVPEDILGPNFDKKSVKSEPELTKILTKGDNTQLSDESSEAKTRKARRKSNKSKNFDDNGENGENGEKTVKIGGED